MTTAPSVPTMLHLRLGGTSVVARLDDAALPCVLHWGPDLGDVSTQALDELQIALTPPYVDSPISSQAAVALLPQHSSGWLGRPGLLGSRAGGRSWSVSFDRVEHRVETAGSADWADGAAGAVRLRSVGLDRPSALEVTTEIEVHPSGLVRVRAQVRNLGADDYEVAHLLPALPVPAEAALRPRGLGAGGVGRTAGPRLGDGHVCR